MADLGDFAKEIQALSARGLEQSHVGHAVFTQGKMVGTPDEWIELLSAIVANHNRIAIRIAKEIDQLRSRLDAANL